jgi:hypothetical protein
VSRRCGRVRSETGLKLGDPRPHSHCDNDTSSLVCPSLPVCSIKAITQI